MADVESIGGATGGQGDVVTKTSRDRWAIRFPV